MKNTSAIKAIFGAAAVLLALSGCVAQTPNLDDHFGEAVNEAIARQTLNPGAASNTTPVTGIEGDAAKAIVETYNKSYKTPTQPGGVFTIGVSSGQSSTPQPSN